METASDWTLQRLFAMKRELIDLRRATSPAREIFNQLTNREVGSIDPKHVVYFRDVYDHLIRVTDELDNYRDLVSGTLDIYVSIVNNDLSRIMKRLTGVTVILAGIGAVAGIFGMSEAGTAFAGGEAGGFWLVTLGRHRARGRGGGVPPPDRLDLTSASAADDRVRLRVGVGVVGDLATKNGFATTWSFGYVEFGPVEVWSQRVSLVTASGPSRKWLSALTRGRTRRDLVLEHASRRSCRRGRASTSATSRRRSGRGSPARTAGRTSRRGHGRRGRPSRRCPAGRAPGTGGTSPRCRTGSWRWAGR